MLWYLSSVLTINICLQQKNQAGKKTSSLLTRMKFKCCGKNESQAFYLVFCLVFYLFFYRGKTAEKSGRKKNKLIAHQDEIQMLREK